MKKSKMLLRLFLTFLKIGAFTFGGGYAMIPLITHETVIRNRWIEEKDILDVVAVAESTPGPVAVNSATLVGYRVGGFLGAVCATVGVVLPSFVIILIISKLLRQFQDLKPVRYAFMGIRAGVTALVIKAFISMYRQCPKSVFAYILMAAAFVFAALTEVNALIIIIGCALFGILRAIILKRRAER